LTKYGGIPSSHADLTMVSSLIYVMKLKPPVNRVLSKNVPTLGPLFWLLHGPKMQVFMTCTFFNFGFSLNAKTQPILGSYEVYQQSHTYFSSLLSFNKPITFKQHKDWILLFNSGKSKKSE
jgi:hypothetical protein